MEMPKGHYFGAIMEPMKAEMKYEPIPQELGPYDVLVKMLYCHICTTDYGMWNGARAKRGYPMAAGHEWSGEVVAVGSEVDLLKAGDRVSACDTGCGQCIFCRQGHTEACIHSKWHPMVNGYKGARNFSDFQIFKQNQLIKMNKELPAYVTAFLEPVTACVSGWRQLKPEPGDTVVVIGAGPMGLINAMVYHALGNRVIITEMSDKKIARANELGWAEVIDTRTCDVVEKIFEMTDGLGADAVVPCAALTSVYAQAQKMIKKTNGKMLIFGANYPEPEMDIDPNSLHYGRTTVVGTFGGSVQDIVLAAKLINGKLVDPSKSLEGAIYPLWDIQNAYIHANTKDMYRISVDLQGTKKPEE